MSNCFCIGPQGGEPLCPCMMTQASEYLKQKSLCDTIMSPPKYSDSEKINNCRDYIMQADPLELDAGKLLELLGFDSTGGRF